MVKTASSLASCWRSGARMRASSTAKAKRLGHVVVGTGFEPEDGVGIGIVPGQHDDRRLKAVLAQDAHRLPPVDVRKPGDDHLVEDIGRVAEDQEHAARYVASGT